MLHIISQSMFSSNFSAAGVNFVSANDVILLMGDGVYSATHPSLQAYKNLYAIKEDCCARGLTTVETVRYIDYAEMVLLTEAHNPVMTWR